MSSTFRVRLTPSSRKQRGPRDRAWQRRHGQATTIGELARDALGHVYPRVVPNRIEAEPLDPQTPEYWRAVWEVE